MKKKIIIIILVLLILVFIISLINVINWNNDRIKTNNQVKELLEKTKIEEVKEIEEIEEKPEEIEEKFNPYYDYMNISLIHVDFSELKKINKDVIGWIQVGGTNINFPIVRTTDNSYYLTHSFDNTYNQAGWIFMDYRNNNLNGKNTIIYGHGRLDKTMFGSLKNVLNDRWYNNVDNYIIKLSTEEKDCVYQVFSVYKIPTTNDYIQTSFTDEQYDEFLTKIKNRSIYKFYNEVSSNDKILTLSTCYSNSEKLVVHAKLIKETSRNN